MDLSKVFSVPSQVSQTLPWTPLVVQNFEGPQKIARQFQFLVTVSLSECGQVDEGEGVIMSTRHRQLFTNFVKVYMLWTDKGMDRVLKLK